MTPQQIKKLETILAKLEALQNDVTNPEVRNYLGYGKSSLIQALRKGS